MPLTNKRFVDMKNNVSTRIGDTSADMKSLIGGYLNQRLRDILQRLNYYRVRTDYSFTTTSGTQEYILPDDVDKVIAVYDNTNKNILTKIPYQEALSLFEGDPTGTDAPVNYTLWDDTVNTQPAATGVVSVVSDSASDTTQKVYIRGIVNSVEKTESITITGTATASGTSSFSRVISVSLDAVTVGKITVTRGASTLAIFSPNQLVYRVQKLWLWRSPAGAYTIQVKYTSGFLPMLIDTDIPAVDVADILELGAEADSWRFKRQFAKEAQVLFQYEKAISEWAYGQENDPNEVKHFLPKPTNRDSIY